MKIGFVIGATALSVGVVSLVAALIIRTYNRADPTRLPRYIFLAGITFWFILAAILFWDCYTSNQWSRCVGPIALVLFAVNCLINRSQWIDWIEKLTSKKQAIEESKITNADQERQQL